MKEEIKNEWVKYDRLHFPVVLSWGSMCDKVPLVDPSSHPHMCFVVFSWQLKQTGDILWTQRKGPLHRTMLSSKRQLSIRCSCMIYKTLPYIYPRAIPNQISHFRILPALSELNTFIVLIKSSSKKKFKCQEDLAQQCTHHHINIV